MALRTLSNTTMATFLEYSSLLCLFLFFVNKVSECSPPPTPPHTHTYTQDPWAVKPQQEEALVPPAVQFGHCP